MWKPQTFYTLTVRVIARDKASTRRLTTAIFHGTSPRGEQSSADAVAEVQMEKSTIENWARKTATEGLVWPLREGREIWGADGAFASIIWRREYTRGSFRAISQWIGVILYGLQTIGTPGAFPKREKLTQRWVKLWQRTNYFDEDFVSCIPLCPFYDCVFCDLWCGNRELINQQIYSLVAHSVGFLKGEWQWCDSDKIESETITVSKKNSMEVKLKIRYLEIS